MSRHPPRTVPVDESSDMHRLDIEIDMHAAMRERNRDRVSLYGDR